jgi:hypothetical protein
VYEKYLETTGTNSGASESSRQPVIPPAPLTGDVGRDRGDAGRALLFCAYRDIRVSPIGSSLARQYHHASMDYQAAIISAGVLEILRAFDPRVVGTLPLGLSVPGSDVDIVCHVSEPTAFAEAIWQHYRYCDGFALYQWLAQGRPLVARFAWGGWPFEVFGDSRPVDQQPGWVHFEIERRLLALDDGQLRNAVARQRLQGIKTEPAFASMLGISGDPYRGMLDLADETEDELRERLRQL